MSHKNQIIITWQSCALGLGVEGSTALSLLVPYMPLNSLLLHIIPVMHSMRYINISTTYLLHSALYFLPLLSTTVFSLIILHFPDVSDSRTYTAAGRRQHTHCT